jgi:hypothetical protein
MNTTIQDIIALQLGKLLLKNITDEFEKSQLIEKLNNVVKQSQNPATSTPLDENGIEIK